MEEEVLFYFIFTNMYPNLAVSDTMVKYIEDYADMGTFLLQQNILF